MAQPMYQPQMQQQFQQPMQQPQLAQFKLSAEAFHTESGCDTIPALAWLYFMVALLLILAIVIPIVQKVGKPAIFAVGLITLLLNIIILIFGGFLLYSKSYNMAVVIMVPAIISLILSIIVIYKGSQEAFGELEEEDQ